MKYEIMIGILFDLLSKKCVSAKYLADKYEVSLRSIYRYINSLELAGVPLYTVRGKGGGFSIVDTYKLSSTFLTREEFENTINALNVILEGVPNKSLESVVNKLKSNIKNDYYGFSIKNGSLVVDGGPWGDSLGYKNKLSVIQKSIDNNLQLNIKYHDRNGEITERIIEPHTIVFKQGLWYVYAYCNLRKEFRLFKTGRIHSATILKTKFIKQNTDKIDEVLDYWKNLENQDEISFKINKSVLSDVEEWLGIENVEEIKDEYFAKAKLPIDNGLVSKILGFGDGIEILAPKSLKKMIIEKAENVINLYKK